MATCTKCYKTTANKSCVFVEDSPYMVLMNNQEEDLKGEELFIFKNHIIPTLPKRPIFLFSKIISFLHNQQVWAPPVGQSLNIY